MKVQIRPACNCHQSYFKGMFEMPMTSFCPRQTPRNAFDVAIICAGDADFFRAVEGVKEMGKEIYIASFDSSCATKLKDASLGYVSLTTYSAKI